VREFADSYGIKLLNSSPYYAQANGQAESSNKTLVKLIKKKIEDNPRRWHEVLSEALWAHRISRRGATKVTPFELLYGQEAILPIEVVDGLYSYQTSYGFASGQIPRRSQGTLLPSSGEPKVSNPWNNVQHKDSI
jgi:hypothetical protein